MRTTNFQTLNDEFKKEIKKGWNGIYQWNRVKSKGNTEIISKFLIDDFDKIMFTNKGHRINDFKLKDHLGCSKLNTPITQFTEKRFCRALYNKYNNIPHPILGQILDYEIPLTEPGQKKGNKINHGDIDLLARKKNEILFIEVKKAKSTESLLKAILEIFVYVVRLKKYDYFLNLLKEYKISHNSKISPSILTFRNSTSGQQILEITKYPILQELIVLINLEFKKYNIAELKFFVIEYPHENFTELLKVDSTDDCPRQTKIVFHINPAKKIIQYPTFDCALHPKYFKDKLDTTTDEVLLKMFLNSYLLFCKQDATKYIIQRINNYLNEFEKYEQIFPKNETLTNTFMEFVKQNHSFVDAYISIAAKHISSDFLNLYLKLLKPNNNKILIPIISKFKNDEILDKLIIAYNTIPIIKSKDYDGIRYTEIDLEDENIIIKAICDYDDKRIIPLLKKSIIDGNKQKTKKKFINKLLSLVEQDELLVFFNDNTQRTFFSFEKNKNAKWAINYLENHCIN